MKTRLKLLVAAASMGASKAIANSILTTLATFNGTNGQLPSTAMFLSGNTLYGTTTQGGTNGGGVVFSIDITAGGLNVLGSFGVPPDSYNPTSGPLLSGSTLYGTNVNGGGSTSFGSSYSVPITGGTPAVLSPFPLATGSYPAGQPIISGNLMYAITEAGGPKNDGAIVSVALDSGTLTELASFNGSNGQELIGGVILSGTTLYGTTYLGGAKSDGTVFSLPSAGGNPTTLATFNGSNGMNPSGTLLLSGNNLYGTTRLGGAYNDGEVFSLPITGGTPTVLASFNGSNGQSPWSALVQSGNTLYGTTNAGGTYGQGTVFSIPITGGSPTVLVSFNGADGNGSAGTLTLSGNTLYGIARYGGSSSNDGTVFSLALNASEALTIFSSQITHFLSNASAGIQVVQIPGITIQTAGTGIVDSGANRSNRQLLVIGGSGLSIAGSTSNWTGTLDLRDNDIDLPGASLATVTNQIDQGYANGKWNGSGGIISSMATADTAHRTALGVIQNNQSGIAIFSASNPFDGTIPGASDVLLKYTYYGDSNLDGKVDGSDYSRIDAAFLADQTNAAALSGWSNGDFNYDGAINGSDYTLIDNAFNTQGVQLTTEIALTTAQLATLEPGNVPEPTNLYALTLGLIGLLGAPSRRLTGLKRYERYWCAL